MRYTTTEVAGCTVVDLQPHTDDRGFFARTFDVSEFAGEGLDTAVEQTNLSFNHRAGTLRGLHRQVAPYAEGKLVRCTRGAIVDVALDVREESATFGRYTMVELSADNRRSLFIPVSYTHLTLPTSDLV